MNELSTDDMNALVPADWKEIRDEESNLFLGWIGIVDSEMEGGGEFLWLELREEKWWISDVYHQVFASGTTPLVALQRLVYELNIPVIRDARERRRRLTPLEKTRREIRNARLGLFRCKRMPEGPYKEEVVALFRSEWRAAFEKLKALNRRRVER